MERVRRPYMSAAEKAEVWRRWKRGESVSDIGRALGRIRKSVHRVVAAHGVDVFCAGGARPPTAVMVQFIDDHRDAYGVESICTVVPIATSTYFWHKASHADPTRRSARVQRDDGAREHPSQVADDRKQEPRLCS